MSFTIANIQRFCLHDGPGIRTTVFLKGCSLRCPWCANPETINSTYDYMLKRLKCQCTSETCSINHNCGVVHNAPIDIKDYIECSIGAIERIGKNISKQELLEIIEKDTIYYKNGGGVTFSGGEPLLQLKSNIDFLKELQSKYNVCIESAMCVNNIDMFEISKGIDFFIIDLKTLVKKDYQNVVHGNLDFVLNNLECLNQCGRTKDIMFRIPYVPGLTNKDENISLLNKLLNKMDVNSIEIFRLHNLAKEKYISLGKEFVPNSYVDFKELELFKSKLIRDVQIIEI